MKKSKIIIPALAIIAFSTAASIAGSVAWFTASRTANVNAGTYTVVKTSADLAVKIESGIGTSANDTTKVVSLPDSVLSDGSVNHKTSKVYTPADNGEELAPAPKGEIDLTDTSLDLEDLLSRGTAKSSGVDKTIYTAVTWDIEFTISFGSIDKNVGLYLDTTASHSAYTTTGTPATAKGFRTAFIPKAASAANAKATVFAGLQDDTNCHYIAGTTDEFLTGTDYEADEYDLIEKDYHTALPSTGTLADYTNRPDFLGTFVFAAGTQVKLSYTVVCWFEGTDPEIINRSNPLEYQAVQSNLFFEAVDLPAA